MAEARHEVELSAAILDYYADRAEELLKPQPLAEAPGSVVVIEPIGELVAIEPWNFPYYQLARVAGSQLAAGNVVIFKHAPREHLIRPRAGTANWYLGRHGIRE